MKKILKAVVSLLLLVLLLSRTDIGSLAGTFKRISPGAISFFLALNVLMVLVNSYRWKVLLGSQGIKVPLWNLFTHYLIGIFFNNFLPGSVGGDIYRAVGIEEYPKDKEKILSSVLMERLLGLIVLLPVSLFAFAALYEEASGKSIIVISELSLAAFYVLVGLFFIEGFLKKFSVFYNFFFGVFKKFDLKEKARKVYTGLLVYWGSKDTLVAAGILSLLGRVIWIFACYGLSKSMGNDLPVLIFFLLLPIIEFVRMFPVSINGIGVREGAFVIYFGAFGMGLAQALVLSVAVYGALLLIGCIGGIAFAVKGPSGRVRKK